MNIFALLLPFLIPIITEAVKQGMGQLLGKMPPKAVPVLAAVIGAMSSQIPGSPITDPGVGLLAGMAGVSVHQVFAGK
ncbi:MAG: hypothetical protein A3E01_09410 [Gammaproteobacteria bacterium RIFCSPHIGHO2_12_FULL_63_22]|nr:MAG: hypothetical protein A3E01_09410 [Gammaproteobacteria bacterium RIFCSPHIGHO2_12_FULL_63_22]